MAIWKVKSNNGRSSWSSVGTWISKTTASSNDSVNDMHSKKQSSSTPVMQQTAPILSLSLELIQQITSYLDRSTAASFCLSTRYIYYAVGTEHLAQFLASANSKIERRKNIEILERAFPSSWFCAWCDRFHRHDVQGGPTRYKQETQRDCAEFNSYLHDSWDYVLCYHHMRLAMNRERWGSDYGIGLDAFTHSETATRKMKNETVNTHLACEARIASNHFLLHATYMITAQSPNARLSTCTSKHNPAKPFLSILPHIVAGHRDSHGSHSGLAKCLEHALNINSNSTIRLCSVCATEYRICTNTHPTSQYSEAPYMLVIEVWRDLGAGMNPFDTSWRAHGELGNGRKGFAGDAIRLTSLQPGDIKKEFESADPLLRANVAGKGLRSVGPSSTTFEESMSESWTQEIISSRMRTMHVEVPAASGVEVNSS